MELSNNKKEWIKSIVKYYNGIYSIKFIDSNVQVELIDYKFDFLNLLKAIKIKRKVPFGHVYSGLEKTIISYGMIDRWPASVTYDNHADFKKMGIKKHVFIKAYKPMIQKIINVLNKQGCQKINLESPTLVPIDFNGKLNSEFATTINSNWYKKLLKKYTEYQQSNNKSDIIDQYYQEQAHLHGLKFLKK